MVGSVSSNFVEIFIIGERIVLRLKSGKITHGSSVTVNPKKHGFNYGKKTEGEVQALSTIPNWGSCALSRYY